MAIARAMLTSATAAAMVLSAGCTQIHRPEQADLGERVPAAVFLHEHLQRQPLVTTAEAYRAVVMLAEGEDTFDSFAAREEYLLSRDIVRAEWKLERDAAIDRGAVAYMVLQVLNLPGGVNFNVMGRQGIGDRRYAVRELAYHDIMADGPTYRPISGAELIDVITNGDAMMAKKGMYDDTAMSVVEPLNQPPAE